MFDVGVAVDCILVIHTHTHIHTQIHFVIRVGGYGRISSRSDIIAIDIAIAISIDIAIVIGCGSGNTRKGVASTNVHVMRRMVTHIHRHGCKAI